MTDRRGSYYSLGIRARSLFTENRMIVILDHNEDQFEVLFSNTRLSNTKESRDLLRRIFLSTKNIQKFISCCVFNEEALNDGTESLSDLSASQNISFGVKLDKGLIDFDTREKVSVGLEDLEKRLKSEIYEPINVAKWNSMFVFDSLRPSAKCMNENVHVLAKYTSICQELSVLPLVEVSFDIKDGLSVDELSQRAKNIILSLVYQLNATDCYIPGVILKIPVFSNKKSLTDDELGSVVRHMKELLSFLPLGIPGVILASGILNSAQTDIIFAELSAMDELENLQIVLDESDSLLSKVVSVWSKNVMNVFVVQSAIEHFLFERYNSAKKKRLRDIKP